MKEKNKEKLLSKRVFNMAMCELIRKTEQEKRYGTSANYRAAFLCFSRFLQEDKKLFVLSKELLSEYEYWLRGRGILWNSISFYMRNLRAMCRCLSDRGVSCRQICSAEPTRVSIKQKNVPFPRTSCPVFVMQTSRLIPIWLTRVTCFYSASIAEEWPLSIWRS